MSRLDELRASGFELYPARTGRTHAIREVAAPAFEGADTVVAGRLTVYDPRTHTGVLEDATGQMAVAFKEMDGKSSLLADHLVAGDVIECSGRIHNGRLAVSSIRLLAPSRRDQPEAFPKPALETRAQMLRLTRRFFEERGYLEVETPYLMPLPELTPALKSFKTDFYDAAGRPTRLYLQTSPEHYMKRMLAAGYERIYQICRFFRNGERYPTHNPEFTGIEWYQAYADYTDIMATTEAWIASLAVELRGSTVISYQGRTIDLSPPWPRRTVRDAVYGAAGIDLKKCGTDARFRRAAEARRIAVHPDDAWDDIFHRLFMQYVEPELPRDRPVFLTEYPAQLPSLAKRTPGDGRFVERCEAYIGGLELGNAFTELNDPEEQRARFETQRRIKQAQEGYEGGVDEALLAALEWGMPPAGGIAVGLDRLIMLFADAATIDEVMAFPFQPS